MSHKKALGLLALTVLSILAMNSGILGGDAVVTGDATFGMAIVKAAVYWLLVFGVAVRNMSDEPFGWWRVFRCTILAVVVTLFGYIAVNQWIWPYLTR